MKRRLGTIFMSFIFMALLTITVSLTLPADKLQASQESATQVYYTSNFVDFYWGTVVFGPLATGQRVKNEINEDSSTLSYDTTKYNRKLEANIDMRGVIIKRSDYPTYQDYVNAITLNSAIFDQSISISVAATISSSITATIGADNIGKLEAEIGASLSTTRTVTQRIQFTIAPGQNKSLYTYKAQSTIYSASHKQTVQTRVLFWWNDGKSTTTSGSVTTFGAGYDVVNIY